MNLKRKNICPLYKKECIGLDCKWISKVEGYSINSGDRLNEWMCTVAALPIIFIENSGMQRQTGASMRSFNDEMQKCSEVLNKIITDIM